MFGPTPRAGLLLIALTLAACGGDDGASRPSVDATFATSAAPTTSTPATETSRPPDDTSASTDTAPPASTTPPGTATPAAALAPATARADQPVDVAVRPGSPPTAFLVERPGRVRLLGADHQPGAVVLDISGDTEADGERGLLGLTFSPDGSLAYVNYTTNGGDTNVDEYRVDASGTFDPASRRPVYAIEQPYGNHNGGDLATGPDGLLYVFTGDGGSAGDPERVALDLASPLGKVLRIDPTPSGDQSFTVPDDNPFVGVAGALGEIWSVGLRNPWRASFDTATGDLWIADVGQDQWEEVSVAWATDGRDAGRGLSFGWSAFEGTHQFNLDQPDQLHTPPLYEYPHGELGCSISGGVRYRGTAVPGLEGWYVFADWCSGLVRALEVLPDGTAGRVVDLGTVPAAVAVVSDARGELLVLSLDGDIVPVVAA